MRGDDDAPLLESPLPDLERRVTGLDPEGARQLVEIVDLGIRSTRRLAICDHGGGVVAFTWPAELKPQALHLYSEGRGARLLAAAEAGGWDVDPRPHLAFRNAAPARRLYLDTTMSPAEYVSGWSGPDRSWIGEHPRETVRGTLWPWLRERGYASPSDDAELEGFMERLGRRPAHLRAGLRLLRRWSRADVAALSTRDALATAIRAEVNRILASVDDPVLRG